jgi:hypothetical protein
MHHFSATEPSLNTDKLILMIIFFFHFRFAVRLFCDRFAFASAGAIVELFAFFFD